MMARDSAGNLYEYVGNNPIDGIDPLGLWQVNLTGGFGIGGQISFGYNNGDWNLGGTIGLGGGLSASYDPTNSDPNQVAPNSSGCGGEHSMGLKGGVSAGNGFASINGDYSASAKWDSGASSIGDQLKGGIGLKSPGGVGAKAGINMNRGVVTPNCDSKGMPNMTDHAPYAGITTANPAITIGGSVFMGFSASNTFR